MDDLLNEFETPQPASSMMRWLACFVDYLMCVLAIGIIFHMLGDFPFITGNDDEIALLNQVIRIAVFVIPWLLLLPVYETINKGQTFGKAMFNVKALNHDGSKLDFG